VDDAVTVALKGCAILRLVVEVGAAFRIPAAHTVGSQTFVFDLFQLLPGKYHGDSLSDGNVIAKRMPFPAGKSQ
jgi:hypothetical protein